MNDLGWLLIVIPVIAVIAYIVHDSECWREFIAAGLFFAAIFGLIFLIAELLPAPS